MNGAGNELIVTLISGDARELSRTFPPGRAAASLSVGTRADWTVFAAEVGEVQFWLLFDGQRLFAASAGSHTPTYLENLRLGREWRELGDGAELRFGGAVMRVGARPVQVFGGPHAAPAPRGAEPRAVEQPHVAPYLDRIDRAAAAPLPDFFRERLRDREQPRRAPHEPSPTRAASQEERPQRARATSSPSVDRFRKRQRVATISPPATDSPRRLVWIALGVSVPLLLAVLAFMWLALGSNRRPIAEAALVVSSAVPVTSTIAVEPKPAPELAVPAAVPELPASDLSTPLLPAAPSLREPAPPETPRQAFPQNVADKPVPRVGDQPWQIADSWRAHHERLLHAPNRALARVVFLGDSITEGWGSAPAYKASFGQYAPLNLGVAGDFTQNVLWRIDHDELAGIGPSVLVLMVGVNNLAGGFSAQQTVSGIRAIVSDVRSRLPAAKILLLAILPAREKPDDPVRQRILEANRMLAALPVMPLLSFHDVGSVLLEPDGSLTKAIVRDYIHPTAAGYERLTGAVAPLIAALLAQP